jgi:hypothetical protein
VNGTINLMGFDGHDWPSADDAAAASSAAQHTKRMDFIGSDPEMTSFSTARSNRL